jgi:hypothetical protein
MVDTKIRAASYKHTLFDDLHFLWVRMDPLGRYHVAEQFFLRYTKYIFFRIKHHLVLMEIVECLFEVIEQIPLHFQLHHYIINVGFDVLPNLSFQDNVHTLLVCAPLPAFFSPNAILVQ